MAVRMLLLQARRDDDPMREHEHRCFVSRTGLPADHVVPHDLCQGPPPLDVLERFDSLTVGGSGEFYVSRADLPAFDRFQDFLREAVERSYPMFASCFGFQSLVRALGGELVHDPARAEVGTFELCLTEAGQTDPLFGTLPQQFPAQMGHKDRVSSFADSACNLASSEACRFQALRIPGKPIWATQFHPELDRETNLDRLRRYLRDYGPQDPHERLECERGFRESPESSALLTRFIALVFG